MNDWLRKLWPFRKKQEFSDERWEEHCEAKKIRKNESVPPLELGQVMCNVLSVLLVIFLCTGCVNRPRPDL